MDCPVCGTSISSGMTLCPACGQTLAAIAPGALEQEVVALESASSSATSLPEAAEQQEALDGSPPPPLTPLESPRQKSRSTRGRWVIVVAAVVLLLVGSSGLSYYLGVYQPTQRIAQVRATAQAQHNQRSTATAQANATAQAQANATAQAQANATATAQAQAQATATALQNIYTQATSGSPALDDPLSNNDANRWPRAQDSQGLCSFTGGGYTISGRYTVCLAQNTTFSNVAYQAEVNILNDPKTMAGLAFRYDATRQGLDFFGISSDGSYTFFYVNLRTGTTLISAYGSSSAIHSGFNQPNLLTVVARGHQIYLYINKQYVDQTTDDLLSTGLIGLMVVSSDGGGKAVMRDVKVWTL